MKLFFVMEQYYRILYFLSFFRSHLLEHYKIYNKQAPSERDVCSTTRILKIRAPWERNVCVLKLDDEILIFLKLPLYTYPNSRIVFIALLRSALFMSLQDLQGTKLRRSDMFQNLIVTIGCLLIFHNPYSSNHHNNNFTSIKYAIELSFPRQV